MVFNLSLALSAAHILSKIVKRRWQVGDSRSKIGVRGDEGWMEEDSERLTLEKLKAEIRIPKQKKFQSFSFPYLF